MSFRVTVFVAAVVLIGSMLLEPSDACPGLFGGGMGGGCGGGCAPPPPSCGCGRKKREVLQPQIRTHTSELCPQKEWESIMEQNLSGDVSSSSAAIQGALYKAFNARFFVSCFEKEDEKASAFVANGDGYCTYSKDNISCQALALFG